ncbi:hypothetical protein [uncultured Chryseobacterium sp.]|uniref:hypothetical protein n=1 Tax=uncultured Chryseobacterium sp. TaxID=259322 RepID=UPI0025CDA0ED|nr:hypothetical protein [uncultured Chryseobacterium sp.]
MKSLKEFIAENLENSNVPTVKENTNKNQQNIKTNETNENNENILNGRSNNEKTD